APLQFHRWQPGQPLEPSFAGIPAPLATAPRLTPTALLIPLLAYDMNGTRLGYGGGYYDRTIESLRHANPALCAVGIAYRGQCAPTPLPHAPHDQPLDAVLTEEGLHHFTLR